MTFPLVILSSLTPALPQAALKAAAVSFVAADTEVPPALANEPVVVSPVIVKAMCGDVVDDSVPPEMALGLRELGAYVSVNVGGAAVARLLHALVPPVMVALVVTFVGLGVPPLHFVAVAAIVAVSAAVPELVRGGENLIVPLILVHVGLPVPLTGLDLAALAGPAPIVITAANGRTIAPAASMSFRVKFTCPP